MSVIAPGTCRHCGCTENNACRLQDGDTCCWTDRTRLVCNAPSCVTAEVARKAAAEQARRAARPPDPFKGWGPGARFLEQRRLERLAKAKPKSTKSGKGRAA